MVVWGATIILSDVRIDAVQLTALQQFWFDHLRGCAAQGKTLSTYAAEQGLSISAFQQAKSRLPQRGLWPRQERVLCVCSGR